MIDGGGSGLLSDAIVVWDYGGRGSVDDFLNGAPADGEIQDGRAELLDDRTAVAH